VQGVREVVHPQGETVGPCPYGQGFLFTHPRWNLIHNECMRAIVYARVSTDEQAEHGTSLDGQVETCTAKANEIDVEIAGVIRDEGVSGSYYEARPGIQQALEMLEAKQASVLIVASISRCSRDVAHQETIRRRANDAGATIVYCDMDIADPRCLVF